MSTRLLILIAYFISCSLSISDVEIVDRIRCVEYCHKASNRRCFAPPLSCGECLNNFQLIDGKCQLITQEGLNLQAKEVVVSSGGSGDSVSINAYTGLSVAWIILIAVLCGVVAFLIVALIIISVYFCIRSQSSEKESLNGLFADPPSYNAGSVPMTEDRKLAYSAQMYHFQHQKQQMINLERENEKNSEEGSGPCSDDDEHHDNVVYECQGLADNSVEMVVNNPYFTEHVAPALSNGPINGH